MFKKFKNIFAKVALSALVMQLIVLGIGVGPSKAFATSPTLLDIVVTAENFNTNKSAEYYGATTGFALAGADVASVSSVKVELYDALNSLLVTNTSKDASKVNIVKQYSSSFRVKTGTYATSSTWSLGDISWTPNRNVKPAKMIVTVTDINGLTYTAENATLSEATATWESLCIDIAPITVTPHVGELLTAGAVTSLDLTGTPETATATYQWKISDTFNGSYLDITGSTTNTYTPAVADFGRFLKVVATGTGIYRSSVTSTATTAVLAGVVTNMNVLGVTAPVTGAIPVSTVTPTDQYTGVVSWSGNPTAFVVGIPYTALITLTATKGYTFTGVSSNTFTVAGATATNSDNSGEIAAVFPIATTELITAIGPISGTPQVGQVLTTGALTPLAATATYKWQASTDGVNFTDISGATSNTYTVVAGDFGKYIRVVANGTGAYVGEVSSAATTTVTAAPTLPYPVTNLTVTVSAEGFAVLNWVNPINGNYKGLTVYRDGAFLTTLAVGATSFTDTNVIAGQTYYYSIATYNDLGSVVIAPVYVSLPSAKIAAGVSDSTVLGTATEEQGTVSETNKEVIVEEKEDVTKDSGLPAWGIILLLILAAIGGYLIYSQKPSQAITKPEVKPVVAKPKKKPTAKTNTKKKK
ncbi:MAG: hypothetical protein WCP14_04010 [bacterium]